MVEKIPLKRLSTADEQAEVIYFLASKNSSYVNGAIFDVNGGQLWESDKLNMEIKKKL